MEKSVENGRDDSEPPRPFLEKGPVAVVDEVDGDVEREQEQQEMADSDDEGAVQVLHSPIVIVD